MPGARLTSAPPSGAVVGSDPEELRRFRLSPSRVEPWEDGSRTDGSRGTYEWWYFDAHLTDGAKLVVIFFTKPFTDVRKRLDPMIWIDLDLPDGTSLHREAHWKPAEFSSADDRCDVRIGPNRFSGHLRSYRIRAAIDDLDVDVELEGELPPWRPGTGHFLFGERRDRFFAWLASVPQGTAEVTYTVGSEAHRSEGVGYHDHNWGNVAMPKLIHNWYWGRGQAGPYSVITSQITAERRYGFAGLPVFMLAKDGSIVAGDGSRMTFAAEDVYTDRSTGKPVANVTRYDYRDGDTRYVVTFTRRQDLAYTRMINELPGLKRLAARLVGWDGAYLRFSGEMRVEHFEREYLVDTQADAAIWELMYFGSPTETASPRNGPIGT
jgi:hypothetical protein